MRQQPGTVTSAGYSGKAGNLIIINHGNGLLTYYMHCNTIFVSAGQKVSKGQNIGQVGTTGNSTGTASAFSGDEQWNTGKSDELLVENKPLAGLQRHS